MHGRRQKSVYTLSRASIRMLTQISLGYTMLAAYSLTFQTHLFSILPPAFVDGFKALCASTLPSTDAQSPPPDQKIWETFEVLGLLDRYESIIASVGYEHIEHHVLSNCTGKWAEPMLDDLRTWMSEQIVPWMVLMYARGATSRVSCFTSMSAPT